MVEAKIKLKKMKSLNKLMKTLKKLIDRLKYQIFFENTIKYVKKVKN